MAATITANALDAYLGKPIAAICSNHYSTPSQSHCAHFVGHVLGLKLGMLCGDMAWKTRHTGATIRVDELYNGLATRGPWTEHPGHTSTQLLFVIRKAFVPANHMEDKPQKHVGICVGDVVYNYSNTHHKVVKDPSVDAFFEKFKQTYAGTDLSLYYGLIP
jgi:hypothetical protein